MNSYNTLSNLKTILQITSSTNDTLLLDYLIGASREVDGPTGANRFFYAQSATKYFEQPHFDELLLPDLLSLSAVSVTENGDWTDEESWTESSHFELTPYNDFPKHGMVLLDIGYKSWPSAQKSIKLTGVWGYGDGESADPWEASAATGTLDSTSDTSLTVDSATGLAVGQTLKIEDEQVFCTALSGTTLTVERGKNGTTAAAHTSKAVYIAKYPKDVQLATLHFAAEMWKTSWAAGFQSRQIGDYREVLARMNPQTRENILARVHRFTLG